MDEFNDFELHSPDSFFQEGMDLLESDHCEEALRAFDSVLLDQPYNSDAFFQRGVTLIKLGHLKDAIISFEYAITLSPTEALFHSHCGYALLIDGRSDAALARFEEALKLQPDNYENKVYKACVLAEKRKLGEARQLLEEVLELHPDDMEVVRHYANVLAALGDEHEALIQFSRILERFPNHLEAISRRGSIFLHQGNRPEAIKCLREYLALNCSDAKAWVTLLETLTEMDQRPAVVAAAGDAIESGVEKAEVYLLRGRALLDERQFDAAITDLRRARTLDDRNGESHLLLAMAFAERGRFRHALLSVNRALQITPREQRCLLLKVRLHHELHEFDQELQILNLLLSESPDDFRLVKMKVDNLGGRNLIAEAAAAADVFLSRVPGHRTALLLSAQLTEQLGDIEASRRRFRHLFSQSPVSVRTYRCFAGFLLRQAEAENAHFVLERAAAEYPLDSSVQTLRAIVCQMLERHGQCVQNLNKYISSGEAPSEASWLLGKSHFALKNYARALESFQSARMRGAGSRGDSEAPEFKCLIAEAYSLHHLKRTADGITLLENSAVRFESFGQELCEVLAELYNHVSAYSKVCAVSQDALEKYPHSSALHYRLARCSAALSRKPAALRHLRAAIELDPKLAQLARLDSKFQRYGLSLSMNRLVNYYFLRRRAEFVGYVMLAALAALATALLARF